MLFEAAWYAEEKKSDRPKYVRLYGAIRSEIEKGNLPANQMLPSIREVSKELGISTTTVENAYNQLMVEGYIYSIPQKGYYVSQIDWLDMMPERKEEGRVEDPKPAENHYIDIGLFHFGEWKKLYNQVLEDCRQRLLKEGDPQGEYELRKALSDHAYRARGVLCEPGQIVIGSGVQTLLSVFCDITEGKILPEVAFEEPGFVDMRPVFQKRGFSLHPIGLDRSGIHVQSLYKTRASVCCLSPSHQFPTGLVMPVQKRMEVLKWAEKTGGYVLEDDYDSELRFSGRPVPSLFSLDNFGHVVYLGSFSTLLAPSIRISYMILPKMLVKDYQNHHYRSTVSTAEQLALARYIESGYFERHLRRLRKKCSTRLKAFLAAAEAYCRDIRIHPSDTGIFVLIEALHHEVFETIRRNAAFTGSVLQEVWGAFFALQYAYIPEEQYPNLLKMIMKR